MSEASSSLMKNTRKIVRFEDEEILSDAEQDEASAFKFEIIEARAPNLNLTLNNF